jgi:hypothetical protein
MYWIFHSLRLCLVLVVAIIIICVPIALSVIFIKIAWVNIVAGIIGFVLMVAFMMWFAEHDDDVI